MKLVIDIPEETFELLKTKTDINIAESIIANGVPVDTSGDCINREALLRKLQKVSTEAWKMKLKCNAEIVWNQCIDYVKDEPPVEPERKIGRWEYYQNCYYDKYFEYYKCSECDRIIKVVKPAKLIDYPYCHCGAKMENKNE